VRSSWAALVQNAEPFRLLDDAPASAPAPAPALTAQSGWGAAPPAAKAPLAAPARRQASESLRQFLGGQREKEGAPVLRGAVAPFVREGSEEEVAAAWEAARERARQDYRRRHKDAVRKLARNTLSRAELAELDRRARKGRL
jgi:hypothetical protein